MEKIKCPGCGHMIETQLQDFTDAAESPQDKEKIKSGEFFMVECSECGEKIFAEHPLMYTDSEKDLHIYLAPEHEDDLLEELNGIPLPEDIPASEGIFRVVSDGAALLEKIMIFDAGRDDRVMELYKAMAFEMLKEDWPKIIRENLLYASDDELLEKIMIFDAGRDDRVMELYKAMAFEMLKEDWPKIIRENLLYASDDEGEFIIVWDYVNAAGEQLTMEFDEELYGRLEADYGAALSLPKGEYAEVNAAWLAERIDVK